MMVAGNRKDVLIMRSYKLIGFGAKRSCGGLGAGGMKDCGHRHRDWGQRAHGG
jgi:hypothetical protein